MSNNIQTSFSIKDLENLSGIKAHTIRIWEKRHNLLIPNRSETNIRTYDTKNLKRLLNISYLNKFGVKISKLKGLSEDEIIAKVNEYIISDNDNDYSCSMFKLAMLNFDYSLFDKTYNILLERYSFGEVFRNVFVPLLNEIGLLWQVGTILPAHEHFISNIIRQKILINTEKVQCLDKSEEKIFVLFLPLNEIHELGLLFLNFELNLNGFRTIFLGPNVSIEDLETIQKTFSSTEFIGYFTVSPSVEKISEYLEEFHHKILVKRAEKLHVLGRNSVHYNNKFVDIKSYAKTEDLLNEIIS